MPIQTTYDEVPYTSHSYPQTHPDRLATLGHLFGMSSKPVTQCRVLELGCAGGGNLIPMAYNLPDSEFIGIDLSSRQVQEAQKTISDLNLNNIKVEHASILDVDRSWGTFDYIICHGVYSWVPDNVQDKILSLACENLAPQGIAYISYNVYPGWHMREMVRHMMRYHADQFDDTQKRIEQARALIDFLSSSSSTDNYFGTLLKNELELVQRNSDTYLFHEHLEDVNNPIYFYQFNERASQHGLQYLGESEFFTMINNQMPDEVSQTLEKISPDIIRREQYMDFLRNRCFRQTLICHNQLELKRNIKAEALNGLLIASPIKAEQDSVDLSPNIEQKFGSPNGLAINTDFPLTKAALTVLNEHWPGAVSVDTLLNKAQERIGGESALKENDQDQLHLLDDLLHCYTRNVVELRTWQSDATNKISNKPKASPLAVYQASKNLPVTNQRHELVNLDILGKELLRVLDGTRGHKELANHLRGLMEDGVLVLHLESSPVASTDLRDETLMEVLNDTLLKLAKATLLIN